MNIDNDYDNDGNNIVPCPICLSNYCPSKENGKCPEEDMFALEGEIRMLLGEYKATDDNSRIANVLEAVEKILHHQLQKAREEAQAEYKQFVLNVLDGVDIADGQCNTKAIRFALESRIIHSELDQDNK